MKQQKGVTIVGVLIGIMILSIALATQIKLLGNTVRREGDMRNLIIATSLAREGIEIAFAWRVDDGWEVLKEHMYSVTGVDYCPDIRDTDLSAFLENGINDCSAPLNPVSYTGYSGNRYSDLKTFLHAESDGLFSSPPFTRKIRIEGCDDDPTHDECLLLTSNVSWDAGKDVEISKKIYNWYVP